MKLVPLDAGAMNDRAGFTAMCALLTEMAEALEDDGEIDGEELAAMRAAVEKAGQYVDRLRGRLKPRVAA